MSAGRPSSRFSPSRAAKILVPIVLALLLAALLTVLIIAILAPTGLFHSL